jgi:hypothetical protein
MRLPVILRERRDDLRRRWLEALEGRTGEDYSELLASPVGERLLRGLLEQLVAISQAEEYELAALRRPFEGDLEREAGRRLALGFAPVDLVAGVQAVRLAVLDVLGDAVVTGELPTMGETLAELRQLEELLDGLVLAVVRAVETGGGS